MIIKLVSRYDAETERIHERIELGDQADNLALVGELELTIGQWQHFGAAVCMGAAQLSGALDINVVLEGDAEVIAAVQAAEGEPVPSILENSGS